MKIWAYDDAHFWGRSLYDAAKAKSYDVELFSHYGQPDAGVVFMHLNHHPTVRNVHRNFMANFASNPNLTLIPAYPLVHIFDDRLEIIRHYAPWFLPTFIFTNPGRARDFLAEPRTFPLVSKGQRGTASQNVRMVNTQKELSDEVRYAFSDMGIKSANGQFQHGFVMWQEWTPHYTRNFRIFRIGSQHIVVERDALDPASSMHFYPVRDDDPEGIEALDYAKLFFTEEHINFAVVDVVRDTKLRFKLCELSVSWHLQHLQGASFVGGRPSSDMWSVIVEELEGGYL